MVCFINAKPKKSDYRRFNIKTVDGIDDFAAMEEVVYRRYKKLMEKSLELPDLILIDGGKGQLKYAQLALKKLSLTHIPIVALAKRLEEVFLPGNINAQSIPKHSSGLMLLKRIRDEAHRFAISFQREKRRKTVLESPLLMVKGIGEKRLKKLLLSFNGLDTISNLTPEIINGEIGIPLSVAKNVISLANKLNKS